MIEKTAEDIENEKFYNDLADITCGKSVPPNQGHRNFTHMVCAAVRNADLDKDDLYDGLCEEVFKYLDSGWCESRHDELTLDKP